MVEKSRHILSVDSDFDSREITHVLLEREGFKVSSVSTGVETLKLMTQRQFGLVLLDDWLSDITGEALCGKIREFDELTPIIFYTTVPLELCKKGAMASGAQDYWEKPLRVDLLIARVRSLLLK